MKPPVFDYVVPETVEEALETLAEHGDEAKVIAGGQSLIPLLNLRMARPSVLVDINRLGELGGLRRAHGRLHIGALTRQAALERSPMVAGSWPLLPTAIDWVAHPQIRARGTVGGSAAHADASAELPAVLTTLDTEFIIRSSAGERRLAPAEFFVGQYESALAPQELLVEMVVPPLGERSGTGFNEYSRRRGDFAIAGAAALIELDTAGRCERARITLLGIGETPVRLTSVEKELDGRELVEGEAAPGSKHAELIDSAVRELPVSHDLHADEEYRHEIAAHVVDEALSSAIQYAIRRRQ